MPSGVVYYNRGRKCLVRLAVSIHSLRKHYTGPVTLILDAEDTELSEKERNLVAGFVDVLTHKFVTPTGKGAAYLNKCLLSECTPYEPTVFLDADTLIKGDISELFYAAQEYDFAIPQFADWKSCGIVGKRIKAWNPLYPRMVHAALKYGPAINFGVFAWMKKSELYQNLWRLALPGRDLSRIPDETCCQLILPQYRHKVVDQRFNCSCKYSNPMADDVAVVHFHGNKHCRINPGLLGGGYEFHSKMWYREFDEVRDAIPRDWIKADQQLRKNLPLHEELNGQH